MKRSITSKITISYVVIVLASLIFVGLFFALSAKAVMEQQAKKSLKSDAQSVFNIIRGDLNNAANKSFQQATLDKIRKATRVSDNNCVFIARNYKVLNARNSEEALRFEIMTLPNIKDRLIQSNSGYFINLHLEEVEYLGFVRPIARGWLVIYTPIGRVSVLSSSLIQIMLISLVLTGILALIFGIFFAKSLAKPIMLLKNKAESMAKRDFETQVDIKTGDELEELSTAINKMASELKDYDMAQRKFLQNASHELKTPLMSIQGYAEGIKDGVFEDNHKALDIIVEESTRLKGIVEELIFLSKLETMEDFYKFTIESINEVVEKSVEKVNGLTFKDNIKIDVNLGKDVYIRMDKNKFIEAFINIIGNCLRYAQNEIIITSASDGNWLDIKIKDDGEGFKGNEAGSVFERFYKGKKGDTGLGLAITKVIIEKHGGTINAANSPEGGAEFSIRLAIN